MVNIIGKRWIPFTFSGILVGASFIMLAVWGLKPGIDFTGGSLLEVNFSGNRPTSAEVQEAIKPASLGPVMIQATGSNGFILRTRFMTEGEHQQVLTDLRKQFEKGDNKVLETQLETIGAAFSAQLRSRAVTAIIAVCVTIIIYIAYAFRKISRPIKSWKYGVAAILALVHDLTITMGIFSLLGHFYGVEVDIPFVVALLTILGYSVNDTIVVFDRIRERLIRTGVGKDFADTVNTAVNETIMRSLNTSMTVLLVLTSLFIFGGSSIHYFALALLIGVFYGTYSSIFIASPIVVVWENWSRRKAS